MCMPKKLAGSPGFTDPWADTVMVAWALFVLSAAEVAVTESTTCFEVLGATYNPFALIVPSAALQVTVVLLVPFTASQNCSVAPDEIVVEEGETVTLTPSPTGVTITLELADAV